MLQIDSEQLIIDLKEAINVSSRRPSCPDSSAYVPIVFFLIYNLQFFPGLNYGKEGLTTPYAFGPRSPHRPGTHRSACYMESVLYVRVRNLWWYLLWL